MIDAAPRQPARASWVRIAGTVRGLPSDLRVYGRSLALLTAAAPPAAAANVVLMMVRNLLPVAQMWLIKLIVDRLAAGAAHAPGAMDTAMALAAVYALTLVFFATLGPIQQLLSAWLDDRAVAEVDRWLMHAGTRLVDLYRIEQPAYHDELHLVRRAAMGLPQVLPQMERNGGTVLTLVGALILLGRLHPLLPVALAAVSIPYLVARRRLAGLKYTAMAKSSRPAREMDYCLFVATDPIAAKVVRVFGLGDFVLRRFRERCAAALSEISRLRVRELRLFAAFGSLQALALAGGFWYVAAQAGAGRLTLGDVALYLNAVILVQNRLAELTAAFTFLYELLLHLRDLFAFLDGAGPAITSAPAGEGQPTPTAFQTGIALRGVRFRYPQSTQEVLHEVSALLPAGKVTAVVGANGAGKSTLVKLLTRMYDPDGGEILLDGLPLAQYDLESLRRRIAVVY
jgi:ATP-binding cassette subfamily B protein